MESGALSRSESEVDKCSLSCCLQAAARKQLPPPQRNKNSSAANFSFPGHAPPLIYIFIILKSRSCVNMKRAGGRPAFNIEAIKSKLRRILLPPEHWSNDEVGAAAYVPKGRLAVCSSRLARAGLFKRKLRLWQKLEATIQPMALAIVFDHYNIHNKKA